MPPTLCRLILMGCSTFTYASNLVPGDANVEQDIFVRDRVAGTTEWANVSSDGSQANNYSSQSHISGDGRLVVFNSLASNLVLSDTNGTWDVFAHERGIAAPSTMTPTPSATSTATAVKTPTVAK